MNGALDGVRVIDFTVWFMGPVGSQHLADFGADVIKLERPQGGDPARGVISVKSMPMGDWNQYFLVINRNKRSMAVDLKKPGGQAVVHRLVAESDVFVSNLGRDALRSWGLDYETLHAINPRLVYAHNSGYGHFGDMTKPSFDMTVQALTGIMARLSEPGEPPVYIGMGSGDAFGGLLSAFGIVVALQHRRLTGAGQFIDTSLYGAQLFLAAPALQAYLAGDEQVARQHARRDVANPLWNVYRARDTWLFLCADNTDRAWRALAATFDDAMLAADDRFATATARITNAPALVDALDAVIATRAADEWVAVWQPLGFPVSPIRTFADLVVDPQAWQNDYLMRAWCEQVHEDVSIRGLPVGLSETPGTVAGLGPELGEQTETILTELLGYSWEHVAELKAEGAIL